MSASQDPHPRVAPAHSELLAPPAGAEPRRGSWWRERELWSLLAVVAVVYLCRLTALPICGEESRWANGASEMLASGDWIVPRQQGEVFPERPPLGSWCMALTAVAWGRMDAVAVRLPSVLALLLTCALIYGYGRQCLSRLGALGAAAAYASFGQVLQLGRLGESEALFTCLLGGALLVWHWGYQAGWPAWRTWTAAYLMAALAALDKGPQAPVYLVAVTCVFLFLRGDRRYLFSVSHAAGILTFLLVVGAWQIPFYLATDAEAVTDIWSGLARDRFTFRGLLTHLIAYPWETLACLLPWSPLLAAYLFRPFRQTLAGCRPQLKYLATALAVTYPTVWISAYARGRYFMPLYPCIALAVGVVIDRWAAAAAGTDDQRAWRWFLRGLAVTLAGGAAVFALATFAPLGPLADARQPLWFVPWMCLSGGAVAWVLWHHASERPAAFALAWLQWTVDRSRKLSPAAVLLLVAGFLNFVYFGPMINSRLNRANDLGPVVAEMRKTLPAGTKLVSFGAIAHRFAYFYGEPIEELPWPETFGDVPSDTVYFCYDLHVGDTPLKRSEGRGRKWGRTQGLLPFVWKTLAKFPCDPIRRDAPSTMVVVGQILGPHGQDADAARRRLAQEEVREAEQAAQRNIMLAKRRKLEQAERRKLEQAQGREKHDAAQRH